ncbi:MAG: elongation factor Ts [Candidatus Bipolaricaulota bacterium]|nr:elongation factor Ts [Candidatus Bipolaricaulota bacterium]MCS7274260.1 elongation factor Ts [Candidatus Bipolaricaulota bacterium]MDW8111044.1 translation elongation factor Ts [Candidatus Bipolaricaulota bacterium]
MNEKINELVKRLREETGIGILDCKRALEQANGDLEKAKKILREQGKEIFAARTSEANQGRVEAYIHHNGRVGVLLEMNCQTDFAANSEAFREVLKDLTMHIAAAYPPPLYIKPSDVPEAVIAQERDVYRKQAQQEGKPPHVIEKIVEGKLQSFYKQVCLMQQPFIKDPSGKTTVEDIVSELSRKTGETIVIKRFARFEVGK